MLSEVSHQTLLPRLDKSWAVRDASLGDCLTALELILRCPVCLQDNNGSSWKRDLGRIPLGNTELKQTWPVGF